MDKEKLRKLLLRLAGNDEALKEGIEYHKHNVDDGGATGNKAVNEKSYYERQYEEVTIHDVEKIFEETKKKK